MWVGAEDRGPRTPTLPSWPPGPPPPEGARSPGSGRGEECPGAGGRGRSRSVWKGRARGPPEAGSRAGTPGLAPREARGGRSGFSGVWSGSGRGRWPPARPSGGPGSGPGALLGPGPLPLPPAASPLPPGGGRGAGHRVGTAGQAWAPASGSARPPGAWAALTHISAPAGRPLRPPAPWPRRAGRPRVPSNSRLPRKPVGGAPAPAAPLAGSPPHAASWAAASPRALCPAPGRGLAAERGRSRFKRGARVGTPPPRAPCSVLLFPGSASSRTNKRVFKGANAVTHSSDALASLPPPPTPSRGSPARGEGSPRELGGRTQHPLPAGSCSTPRTSA